MSNSDQLQHRARTGLVVLIIVFILLVTMTIFILWSLVKFGCQGITIPGLLALTLFAVVLFVVLVVTRQWIFHDNTPEATFGHCA